MKTKLPLLLIGLLMIISSCQKSDLNSSSNMKTKEDFNSIKISYEDTTTLYRLLKTNQVKSTQSKDGLSTFSTQVLLADPKVQINYKGNGTYELIVWNNTHGDNIDCTYTFFKNGVQMPLIESAAMSARSSNPALVFTVHPYLAPANYEFVIFYNGGGTNAGRTVHLPFTIYNKPLPPSGKAALYRYLNPRTQHRVYSTNWEELASGSQNYFLEKVQCYMWPSSGSNTQLVYRYYNRASDDHWLTTSTDGANGYVLEGGIGYISTITTTEMTLPLIEYFSTTFGHSYKSPPEALTPPDFVNATVGYVMPPQ